MSENWIQQEHLSRLLANDDLDKVIEILFQELSARQREFPKSFTQLTLAAARNNDLLRQKLHRELDSNTYAVERKRIHASLSELVNDLAWEMGHTAEESVQERIKSTFPEASGFRFDVFLCYSTKDSLEAKDYYQKLTSKGLSVFFAEESLKSRAGISFIKEIEIALESSRNFILLSSKNSPASKWVEVESSIFFKEFYLDDQENRRIYIVKGKGFKDQHVPLLLRSIQVVEDFEQLETLLKDQRRKEVIVQPERRGNTPKGRIRKLSFSLPLIVLAIIGIYLFGPKRSSDIPVRPIVEESIPPDSQLVSNYIKRFEKLAVNNMEKYGIPASVKLAAAIISSNAGTNMDARLKNDHFNISSYENGVTFSTAWENWEKHSQIISQDYGVFFRDSFDYRRWSSDLGNAPYFKDFLSSQDLINVIEEYRLYLYDYFFLVDTVVSEAQVLNFIERYQQVARAEMEKFNIPVSIKLAQGILESKAGLSPKAAIDNNCFEKTLENEVFNSRWESWRRHSLYLIETFPKLVQERLGYKSWIYELRKSSIYDFAYIDRLEAIIAEFKLASFDERSK